MESFRNIHRRMLCWDDRRAGIELYMSLEGKIALKVEEAVENHDGSMGHGERMTEYLDELICLFRKARPGAFVQFQEEEVKDRLING